MPYLIRPLLLLAPLALALAGLSGCSTTPIPTDQMAVSTAAVASATSAGGGDLAPGEMKAALQKTLDAMLKGVLPPADDEEELPR